MLSASASAVTLAAPTEEAVYAEEGADAVDGVGEGFGGRVRGASTASETGVPETAGDDVIAVVNTGALLARWTNDRWRATAHRVVAGPGPAAPRYAIAAFVDPDADAEIAVHPSFVEEGDIIKSVKILKAPPPFGDYTGLDP